MLGLASILLLGIGAQWLAWRLKIPSILLLLLAGFAVGPFTGHRYLDPDALLGDSLRPFVALSVAVILFEGGLTLRFREIEGSRRAVTGLVFVGPVFTFAIVTLLARWPLGFSWRPAALLGALLVVTGPTVIGPLLRSVRPSATVARVIRWEGIVTDPIGAILAVLVFQVFLAGNGQGFARGVGLALFGGGGFGLAGGYLVVVLLRRKLIPDFLHAPVTLLVALTMFVLADRVQHESGLLAVTVMGMVLANQRRVVIEHILEFKENLRVILVSMLFILLAAQLPMEEFTRVDWRSAGFVVLLIVVARPLSVFLCTLGTGLSWAEKAFVAWMAPRGIVAAAVASVFALDLDAERFPEAERLVPVVFLVIITTVVVYGLTAGKVARRLGLSKGEPQGFLIVGAHAWARAIAKGLTDAGVEVLLIDTNYSEVQKARIAGLRAHYGNILGDDFEAKQPLDDIGHLMCLTHNDQVNALACLQFASILGRDNVHQLAPEDYGQERAAALPAHLRGHVLFGKDVDYWELESRFRSGATIKRTRLSDEFDLDDFRREHESDDYRVLPLFAVSDDGIVNVVDADEPFDPQPEQTLIALIGPARTPASA